MKKEDNPLNSLVVETIKDNFGLREFNRSVPSCLYGWDFYIDGVIYYFSHYHMRELFKLLGLDPSSHNMWDFCCYRNKPPIGNDNPPYSSITKLLVVNKGEQQ